MEYNKLKIFYLDFFLVLMGMDFIFWKGTTKYFFSLALNNDKFFIIMKMNTRLFI